jgi:hypothetical protein
MNLLNELIGEHFSKTMEYRFLEMIDELYIGTVRQQCNEVWAVGEKLHEEMAEELRGLSELRRHLREMSE